MMVDVGTRRTVLGGLGALLNVGTRRTVLGGLGAASVATVDSPSKCPAGSRAQVIAAPTGSSIAYYQCMVGESWPCELFGWGCVGPPAAAAPAAPKTTTQMTQPGAWTPEQSASESWEETQRRIAEYFANTSGVAQVPAAINEGVEGTLDIAKSVVNNQLLWIALGAAGVVLLLVAVKR